RPGRPGDVRRAVRAAGAAQAAWAELPLVERVELLRELHRAIMDDGEDIAQRITLETGKTINETREELAEYTAPAYQKAAEEVLRHRGMSLPSTQERSNNKRLVFFFQAEDGIRDWSVTGVQTCALPI